MTKYTPENEVKIILHTVSQQLIFPSTHMHVLTCQGEQIATFTIHTLVGFLFTVHTLVGFLFTVHTLVGFLEPLSIVFGW